MHCKFNPFKHMTSLINSLTLKPDFKDCQGRININIPDQPNDQYWNISTAIKYC